MEAWYTTKFGDGNVVAISDFFVQPPSKFFLKKKKRKTGSNVKLSVYLSFLPVNKMEGMTSHDSQ